MFDRWILYAPDRVLRPGGARRAGKRRRGASYDPTCPFCPGNEAMLPRVIAERGGAGPGPWATRVAPNRYPILVPDDATTGGRHEVVIESPVHGRDLADMDDAEAEAVVATWRDRYRALARDAAWVVVFRNRGDRAGASLAHPHAQIIATAAAPPGVQATEARAERHHARTGRRLLSEIVARERDEGCRVVIERSGFIAFVPRAAEVPCELWIAPLRPRADFGAVADDELAPLAALVRDVLARLRDRVGDPDYNLIIAGASRGRRRAAWQGWFARLRPRLVEPAGFEIASGLAVNPSLPERDAALLRSR